MPTTSHTLLVSACALAFCFGGSLPSRAQTPGRTAPSMTVYHVDSAEVVRVLSKHLLRHLGLALVRAQPPSGAGGPASKGHQQRCVVLSGRGVGPFPPETLIWTQTLELSGTEARLPFSERRPPAFERLRP